MRDFDEGGPGLEPRTYVSPDPEPVRAIRPDLLVYRHKLWGARVTDRLRVSLLPTSSGDRWAWIGPSKRIASDVRPEEEPCTGSIAEANAPWPGLP